MKQLLLVILLGFYYQTYCFGNTDTTNISNRNIKMSISFSPLSFITRENLRIEYSVSKKQTIGLILSYYNKNGMFYRLMNDVSIGGLSGLRIRPFYRIYSKNKLEGFFLQMAASFGRYEEIFRYSTNGTQVYVPATKYITPKDSYFSIFRLDCTTAQD